MHCLRHATKALILLSSVFALGFAAVPEAESAASYYLKFELGKGGSAGTEGGGETFLYNFIPTPVMASHHGCRQSGGSCVTCANSSIRHEGDGTASVIGGEVSWIVSATERCKVGSEVGLSTCDGKMTITDVVFDSPGSADIPVSLNLDAVNTAIDGQGTIQAIVKIRTTTVLNTTSLSSGPLTTSTATVPVNTPVQVSIQLRGSIRVEGGPSHPNEGSLTAALRFVSSQSSSAPGVQGTAAATPVFNVPSGVTVNSVEGSIVDNTWNAPVPTRRTTWGSLKSLYE